MAQGTRISSCGVKSVFFHVRDLDESLPFDDTLLERRVTFNVVETEKGPRAADVRPV